MLNPLRSEAEAFRFFVYVLVTIFVIMAIILIARAVL